MTSTHRVTLRFSVEFLLITLKTRGEHIFSGGEKTLPTDRISKPISKCCAPIVKKKSFGTFSGNILTFAFVGLGLRQKGRDGHTFGR